ncbi:hypothetical protein, partial [Vibrio azureus]|uniref:hypothetical protein n=1 Tax=Vibrio azureus TaxID=512649 RepID=UPI001D10003E
ISYSFFSIVCVFSIGFINSEVQFFDLFFYFSLLSFSNCFSTIAAFFIFLFIAFFLFYFRHDKTFILSKSARWALLCVFLLGSLRKPIQSFLLM